MPRRLDYFNVLIYFGKIHIFSFFILLFSFGLGLSKHGLFKAVTFILELQEMPYYL